MHFGGSDPASPAQFPPSDNANSCTFGPDPASQAPLPTLDSGNSCTLGPDLDSQARFPSLDSAWTVATLAILAQIQQSGPRSSLPGPMSDPLALPSRPGVHICDRICHRFCDQNRWIKSWIRSSSRPDQLLHLIHMICACLCTGSTLVVNFSPTMISSTVICSLCSLVSPTAMHS